MIASRPRNRLGSTLGIEYPIIQGPLGGLIKVLGVALIASLVVTSCQPGREVQRKERPVEHPTMYRTRQIDGLSIFYREAGPKDAPALLLLHGLPSSSRMFEPLFSRLSEHYHLVAPDYPGFGHSDWPIPRRSLTRSTTTPRS